MWTESERHPLPEVGARFDLTGAVRSGAGTVVFVGDDVALGCRVVLKVFDDPQQCEREAAALSVVGAHPLIPAPLLRATTGDERVFLAFRNTGETIGDLHAAAGGPLPLRQRLHVGVQLAGVLASIHAFEIVHADLSPTNVVVDSTGSAHLIDFGSAVSPGGTVVGATPAFAAPEVQTAHRADPASDIYSLCRLLLHLSGDPDTSNPAETVDTATLIPATNAIVDGSALGSFALASILRSGLAVSPSDRPDALAVARALRRAQVTEGFAATSPLVDRAVEFEPRLIATLSDRPAVRIDRWVVVIAILMILTLAVGVYTAANLPG